MIDSLVEVRRRGYRAVWRAGERRGLPSLVVHPQLEQASMAGDDMMLVLTRKVGERIQVNDAIAITVVQIGHGRVRLGFEAPPGVKILREELCGCPSRRSESKTEKLPEMAGY